MNFFPNIPMMPPGIGFNNNFDTNGIIERLVELENRVRRLEQRISKLENDSSNYSNYSNYSEPDNSLYMI